MKKILFSFICFIAVFVFVYGQSADSSGTGFFITDNGIIITCAHVIEDGDRITVKINNTEYPAEVISSDSETDLAVLRINYRNPYHFTITDFGTLNLGDRLSVLGFPLPDILSSDIRFTEGSLSARSGLKSDPHFFQHSAPTQPGNSGGPILNSRYEVVGVAAAIINDTVVKRDTGTIPQNINFGVKSGFITQLLDNIRPGAGNIRSINDAEKATVQILSYTSAKNFTSMTVVNRTGYTGWYLYISPASDTNWGPDRLGEEVLRNGRSITLRNIPASRDNLYDVRLVDEDEDSYTKWNVRILPNQSIEFSFDDFDSDTQQSASESFDGPPVTIINNTGYTIYYIYISPVTSETWGTDRLASDQVLSGGHSVTLRLPFPLSAGNKYDIMLEDSEGDTYSKYNVTVASNTRIVFTLKDMD